MGRPKRCIHCKAPLYPDTRHPPLGVTQMHEACVPQAFHALRGTVERQDRMIRILDDRLAIAERALRLALPGDAPVHPDEEDSSGGVVVPLRSTE